MATAVASAASSPLSTTDILSLLQAGSVRGLSSLGLASSLDLETVVPVESLRATEHFNKLRGEFIAAETKQRMLAAMVKEETDQDGMMHALKTAVAAGAESDSVMRAHKQAMEAMEEKQKQSANALAEIQHHTKELAGQIKTDIQKLLQAWNNVERAESSLAKEREDSNVQAESHLWAGVNDLWESVEDMLKACNAVQGIKAPAPDCSEMVALQSAFDATSNAITHLSDTFPTDPAQRKSFDISKLESMMGSALEQQLQALADWNARCTELKSELYQLQKKVPRIGSFKAAAVAAMDDEKAKSQLPPNPALQAARTALSVLARLSGVVVLRSMEEEYVASADSIPTMATRMTVCVRALPTTASASSSTSNSADIYSSPEAFAAAILNNNSQQPTDADYYVLDIMVHTSAQQPTTLPSEAILRGESSPSISIASNHMHASSATLQLLSARLLGQLPAKDMDELQKIAADAQAQAHLSNASGLLSASNTIGAELERHLLPIPSSNMSHAATVLIQQTLAMRNLPDGGSHAMTMLIRELPFVMQQASQQ